MSVDCTTYITFADDNKVIDSLYNELKEAFIENEDKEYGWCKYLGIEIDETSDEWYYKNWGRCSYDVPDIVKKDAVIDISIFTSKGYPIPFINKFYTTVKNRYPSIKCTITGVDDIEDPAVFGFWSRFEACDYCVDISKCHTIDKGHIDEEVEELRQNYGIELTDPRMHIHETQDYYFKHLTDEELEELRQIYGIEIPDPRMHIHETQDYFFKHLKEDQIEIGAKTDEEDSDSNNK